jgi:hypothetical protein
VGTVSERTADAGTLPEPPEKDLPDASTSLARELAKLTQALLSATTVDGVLDKITVAARYLIPNADVASITIRQEAGKYRTPAESDQVAATLDQGQYDAAEGPCVDAADPKGPANAYSGDLAAETAWPVFAAEAVEHGFASVLSTALITLPEPTPYTAALNVYSHERNAFDGDARDTAFLLATYASLALVSAYRGEAADRALERSDSETANLRKALDTRTVIGQGTGILMARRGLSAEEAFGVLSRASQRHNVKLADLADILARHPDTAERL